MKLLGIGFSKTRIGQYKALFSTLAEYQLADNLGGFYDHYSFETWVNAAYEVAELVRIYEGLNEHKDSDLVSRLRDSLKGHELYVVDSKDRSGRDFSFELAIAAKFCRYGYIVDFGHDADLKVQINGYDFFVECKRLKSSNKVQKRIKAGLSQLHKRYVKSNDPSKSRGLLMLSIAKTVNQKLDLLEASDSKDLAEKAFAYNLAFTKKYKKYWQERVDQRTLGVGVIFDVPGVLKASKQLIMCHEVTINNSVPDNSPEYELLCQVAGHVFLKRT
ncbi:MAG: hypothetical protein ACI8WB_000315 [Phenylobacterium sp.]